MRCESSSSQCEESPASDATTCGRNPALVHADCASPCALTARAAAVRHRATQEDASTHMYMAREPSSRQCVAVVSPHRKPSSRGSALPTCAGSQLCTLHDLVRHKSLLLADGTLHLLPVAATERVCTTTPGPHVTEQGTPVEFCQAVNRHQGVEPFKRCSHAGASADTPGAECERELDENSRSRPSMPPHLMETHSKQPLCVAVSGESLQH